MATYHQIFSLYRFAGEEQEVHYLLIRTLQPAYSNADQQQEDMSMELETAKRHYLLNAYTEQQKIVAAPCFIGELQLSPIGDELYADFGQNKLPVFYQETRYGHPWIILGTASSREEFIRELEDDDDLMSLQPQGIIHEIEATFITEKDADLSAIAGYRLKDMREIDKDSDTGKHPK